MSSYGDDQMGGCLGALLGLAFLAAVATAGFLLVTSQAVLFSEQKVGEGPFSSFQCKYFTGTRVVETAVYTTTGCKRFIPVGAQ